jgi:hypothetical protein
MDIAAKLGNAVRWPWSRCESCGNPRNNPMFDCKDICGFHRCSRLEDNLRHLAAWIRFLYCFITHRFQRYDFCCVDGDYGVPHECMRGSVTPEEAKETISGLAWAISAKLQRGEAYVIAEAWAENTAWALTQAVTQIERLEHELAAARKSA